MESGVGRGRVVTRFPPEPNGYLHVGHATAICLNFGIAEDFDGQCHLRYDDTNPEKEDEAFARAIQEDIRWLGFDWGENLYYASDFFERMYDCAVTLIQKGLAYVDSQPLDAVREGRGSVTEAGSDSPFRDRSVEENLNLFARMKAGEFADGTQVLRGRIDMGHANMLMRDPILYRIRHIEHFRQGDSWCIYPLYDYAHCLEDAFEGVTHSICTIEFENNRELYDWVLESVGYEEPRPHQYEWAGLDLEYAVLSKRAILPLVAAGIVSGWDDPRLATIAAWRRRGIPAAAIRLLAKIVGVSRSGGRTEESKLDYAIREVLNPAAPRVMAVLDPLKVVLTNFPEGEREIFDAPHFPHDIDAEGSREVPFSRELWIERDDFPRTPERIRRLVPGGRVRLRYAYVVRCDSVVHDENGVVKELHCTYDPATKSGSIAAGRKVKGIIHWVSAPEALEAEVRLFSPLFLDEESAEAGTIPVDPVDRVNPDSLTVLRDAWVEPSVASDEPATRYQFERTGYFWRDPVDGLGDRLVFNRIVGLKSSYHGAGKTEATKPVLTDRNATSDSQRTKSGQGERATTLRPQMSNVRAKAREQDPVLADRFTRYISQLGLSEEHADLLTGSRGVGEFFEVASTLASPHTVAAWLTTDVRALLRGRTLTELPFDGAALGRLVGLTADGLVSRRAAKEVLARMAQSGGDPASLVEEMGLGAVSDEGALGEVVDAVLAAWPAKVEEYRGGRRNLLGLFVGEVMKATSGAADPAVVRSILAQRLDS